MKKIVTLNLDTIGTRICHLTTSQDYQQVWQPEFGLVPFFICLLYQPFEFQKMLCCIFNFLTAKFTF